MLVAVIVDDILVVTDADEDDEPVKEELELKEKVSLTEPVTVIVPEKVSDTEPLPLPDGVEVTNKEALKDRLPVELPVSVDVAVTVVVELKEIEFDDIKVIVGVVDDIALGVRDELKVTVPEAEISPCPVTSSSTPESSTK